MPSLNTPSPSPSPNLHLHLPRILCLHGGGVTAQVFRLQSRGLLPALSPTFRLVLADAPFTCAAGPGILPFYAGCGPYRRWLRWLPEHPAVSDAEAIAAIEKSMREAMEADDEEGGRGEWVGLMGFSQGGKVAASVLFESQVREEEIRLRRSLELNGEDGGREPQQGEEEEVVGFAGGRWRFAVLLAARGSLVALSERTFGLDGMEMPGGFFEAPREGERVGNQHRLRMPTVHVHGLNDPGLEFHRVLLDDFTTVGSAELVEWDGDHRVPIKTSDVDRVVNATLKAAKKAGLLANLSQL